MFTGVRGRLGDEMTGDSGLRFGGWFDENLPDDLEVELLVIERAVSSMYGPWQVGGAMIRVPGQTPRWVEGWVDDYWLADPASLWEYFVEKGGGNAYTYEVAFLRIEQPADAEAVIHHLEGVLANGHPLGLTAPVEEVAATDPTPADIVPDVEPDDPCDNHFHVDVPFVVADAMTWQLAVELVRRHPADLWVIRTFPMDGHYDCLSVRRLGDVLTSPSVAINRHGSHVKVDRLSDAHIDEELPLLSWGDAFAMADPRDWIRRVEDAAGLRPTRTGLPPSTRSSIALRWVGMLLRMQVGGRERWTAWNDWSQVDWGEPATDFDAVPEARDWLRTRKDHRAAAHVWFVGTDNGDDRRIHFAVNSEGTLWPASGKPVDLMAAYRGNGSSISRLVIETAGRVLA